MDKGAIASIILMIVIYAIPELFRRIKNSGRTKQYQYPKIPEKKKPILTTISAPNVGMDRKDIVRIGEIPLQLMSVSDNLAVISLEMPSQREQKKIRFDMDVDVKQGVLWSCILEKPLSLRKRRRY